MERDYDRICERYVKLRAEMQALNTQLLGMLSQEDILRAGRHLGLVAKKNTFVFADEDEAAILADHAIHGVFHKGRNLVDRCLQDDADRFSESELSLLQAMSHARFTILIVGETVRDTGLRMFDLLRSEEIFLADVLFSQSAEPGLGLAGRIVTCEDFFLTTGAMLPASPEDLQGFPKDLLAEAITAPTGEANAKVAAQIARVLLAEGNISSVAYGSPCDDIDALAATKTPLPCDERSDMYVRDTPKVGRNDPCPCGSGKKYKKCCLGKDRAEAASPSSSLETRTTIPGRQAVVTEGRQRQSIVPGLWEQEEVEDYTTDEIIDKLRSFGIDFDTETFLQDARRLKSVEIISDLWFERFDVTAKGFDEDFPWLACMVLFDRLASDIPSVERLCNRIDEGYDRREEDDLDACCAIWLSAWDTLRQHFVEGLRSIEEVEEKWPMDPGLLNWCQDLDDVLDVVSGNDPSWQEKRIAYCQQFVRILPDTHPDIIRNMRLTIAAWLFETEGSARGDAEFQKLVDAAPDDSIRYVCWGDCYTIQRPTCQSWDMEKAERIYRMARDRGVEDVHGLLRDRFEILAEERKAQSRESD